MGTLALHVRCALRPALPAQPLRSGAASLSRSRATRERRARQVVASSSSSDTPVASLGSVPELKSSVDYGLLYARFVRVARPYWTEAAESGDARLRLAGIVAMTLGTTGISVGFNFLGRDFFNAIAEKHPDEFYRLLFTYLAAIAGAIPVFVLRDYWQSLLALRWRAWLTERYVGQYLGDQTFFRIAQEAEIDNPDQRINADVGAFTATALGFALTLFNAGTDLVSFSGILWGIYPPLFGVLLVYSLGGSAASVWLGSRLVGLNFLQEAREADFRYALVRVRENAESIAFYGGEAAEEAVLRTRFAAALGNLRESLGASRNLAFFTSFYRFIISFLPAAVVAPLFFRGEIEFGVINQSSSAFNHILGDVSLVVYQFEALAGFAATVERVGQFEEALHRPAAAQGTPQLAVTRGAPGLEAGQLLRVTGLTLAPPRALPGAVPLVRNLSFEVRTGQPLLIVGPSGSGKTSLLRALAGLWRDGEGEVAFAGGDGDVFFVPQKPYLVLGSLRAQLLYPTWSGAGSDADAAAPPPPGDERLSWALERVALSPLLSRLRGGLDGTADWGQELSLGEQQRLAAARLLLARPRLALLDESTSALDGAAEASVYAALAEEGVTCVSVGHRPSLLRFHSRLLRLAQGDAGGWKVMDVAAADTEW